MARCRRRFSAREAPSGRLTGCWALLDMPAAWLLQLVSILPQGSLLAMLQTCTTLRHMVLSYPGRLTTLALKPLQSSLFQLIHSLRYACVVCPKLRLVAQHDQVLSAFEHHHMEQLFTHTLWGMLQTCAKTCSMTCVKSLQLKGAHLDALLPAQVRAALPHLTHLDLVECTINWDSCSATSFEGPLPPLQQLVVQQCGMEGDDSKWHSQLAAQVSQLSALRELRLTAQINEEERQVYQVISRSVPAGQLTDLCVSVRSSQDAWTDEDEDEEDNASPQPHLSWLDDTAEWAGRLKQGLTHLMIPSTELTEVYVGVISQMAQLKRLSVKCIEEEVLAQHSLHSLLAQLQELTLAEVTVPQLAKIPLHNKLSLQVSSPEELELQAGAHAAVMEQAAARLAQCAGIKWDVPWVSLGEEWHSLEAEQRDELLLKCLPLVASPHSCVPHVQLDCMHLPATESTVTVALQAALRACPQLHTLHFGPKCTWEVTGLCRLVSCGCLHEGFTLKFHFRVEDDITRVCCAATAPMHLQVVHTRRHHPSIGAADRIAEAMTRCNQQHVKVEWVSAPCYGVVWDDDDDGQDMAVDHNTDGDHGTGGHGVEGAADEL